MFVLRVESLKLLLLVFYYKINNLNWKTMLPLALEMGEEGGQVSTSVELDSLFPELEINPGLKTAPWREAPEKLPTAGSPSV